MGLLIYAGTGVACMCFEGHNFLDYNALEHNFLVELPAFFGDKPTFHFLPSGQHLGIFLVELGVGITVTAVMTMIFYAFAGREQVQ